MPSRIELCKAEDVPPGEVRRVEAGGMTVAVYNLDGDFYVTDDACTHGPGQLSEGFVEGDCVERGYLLIPQWLEQMARGDFEAGYATAADAFGRNASLTAVEVRPSRLSGVRRIVDVIFSFTHRQTDVTEKSFVRVDMTEEFPFLITRLSPYYDR